MFGLKQLSRILSENEQERNHGWIYGPMISVVGLFNGLVVWTESPAQKKIFLI